jgi:hypothetical protein
MTLNKNSEKIFKLKYARGNETWEQACIRVASYIANAEENEDKKLEYTKKFYELIYNKVFIPGGRILANSGTGIKNLMNCVSGDTLIHTKDGAKLAKEIDGKDIEILSSDGKFRKTTWSNYGEQLLYEVILDNGDVIYTTSDHEWISYDKNGYKSTVTTLELENKRIPFQPILDSEIAYNENEYKNGVVHGLVYGDGTLYSNRNLSMLQQFGDSKEIIPRFFSKYKTKNYGDYRGEYYEVAKLPNTYKTNLPNPKDKSI